MVPEWYRIHRVRRENHDTFTLDLRARDRATEFTFNPGQFNMLYAYGVGEVPISISGDPGRTEALVHTVRAVGTVTQAMWRMKRGDTIGVRGPFGSSWPLGRASGRDLVIVAGGIGLAPLRPVIYDVLARRSDFRHVVLLYGARSPQELLFDHELLPPHAPAGLDVQTTVDRSVNGWQGSVGVVTTLIPKAEFDPRSSIAMVCGPEVMMRFTIKALTDRGMGKDQIYVSTERNMKCGIGLCGHCQYGPRFICKDGPVFRFDEIEGLFGIREL
jgi:NAD(P)H-flavin reductase